MYDYTIRIYSDIVVRLYICMHVRARGLDDHHHHHILLLFYVQGLPTPFSLIFHLSNSLYIIIKCLYYYYLFCIRSGYRVPKPGLEGYTLWIISISPSVSRSLHHQLYNISGTERLVSRMDECRKCFHCAKTHGDGGDGGIHLHVHYPSTGAPGHGDKSI